jgi:hypothetical protein
VAEDVEEVVNETDDGGGIRIVGGKRLRAYGFV